MAGSVRGSVLLYDVVAQESEMSVKMGDIAIDQCILYTKYGNKLKTIIQSRSDFSLSKICSQTKYLSRKKRKVLF